MKTIFQIFFISVLITAVYVVYIHGWGWTESEGVRGVAYETIKEIRESEALKKVWCGTKGC